MGEQDVPRRQELEQICRRGEDGERVGSWLEEKTVWRVAPPGAGAYIATVFSSFLSPWAGKGCLPVINTFSFSVSTGVHLRHRPTHFNRTLTSRLCPSSR